MDVFRQLTRGIHFDRSKFPSESAKFGLLKKKDEGGDDSFKTTLAAVTVSLDVSKPDSNEPSEEDEEVEEEDDDDQDVGDLTLLGDIKVRTTTGKDRRTKKKKLTRERREQMYRENVNHFRNAHRIHVSGSDVPDPVDGWDKLRDSFGIPSNLLQAIAASYPRPTPVQMQVIPMLLDRREVLTCAPTGSGKTAAYLIPIIHLLREPRNTGFRAVIVAPTRELALQIHREAVKLGGCRGLRTLVLDQLSKVTKKFKPETALRYDILVTTPNRLVYMLNDKVVELTALEWLIVDESDKLFEAGPKGFREQLGVIYRACSESSGGGGGGVRRAMFSATMAADVESWCKMHLDNVVTCTIGARNTATETVKQRMVYAGSEKGKLLAFRQLVREGLRPPVLVFVQSKERAKELHDELAKEDLRVDVIHSERSQLQRDSTVKAFRSGRVWILICTELMGRGIDFKGVNLVVNYDFPPSTVSYIHRIGRTGRAGRPGEAVTFFTDDDKILLRSIASIVKAAGGEVPEYMLKLKKASRQDKRRLASRALTREGIRQESKYDKEIRVKKEEMIAASKRRKRTAEEGADADVGVKKKQRVSDDESGQRVEKKRTKKNGKTTEQNLRGKSAGESRGKKDRLKKLKKKTSKSELKQQ